MRTTLDIDDDVLAIARSRATRERTSIGHVLSALARAALQPKSGEATTRNGIPLLPRKAGNQAITPELVNQLRDELP